MQHYQGHQVGEKRSEDGQDPKNQRTNEFVHRASEFMGLDWSHGQNVSRVLLRNIIKRLTPGTARSFMSNLPLGFKKECSPYAIGPLKSIGAQKVLLDIKRAAQSDQVDAKAIARLFWLFLEGELHEGQSGNKGILNRVLSELPRDIRALLTRQENAL